MKLKAVGIICIFIGLLHCPVFGEDYVNLFTQTMHIQPAQASAEQLRAFYKRYSQEKEKQQVLVQLASAKKISVLEKSMPSIKFIDFALTIENQLPSEDASILVPIYKDVIEHVAFYDTDMNAWRNKINAALETKVVRVGEFNLRASWIAHGALFQAVLQHYLEESLDPVYARHSDPAEALAKLQEIYGKNIYLNEPSNRSERVDDVPKVMRMEAFAANGLLFASNNAARKKLMRNLLRKSTKAVVNSEDCAYITYRGNDSGDSFFYFSQRLPGVASKNKFETLLRIEKLIKNAGGAGLETSDPNWQKIRTGKWTVIKETIRAWILYEGTPSVH